MSRGYFSNASLFQIINLGIFVWKYFLSTKKQKKKNHVIFYRKSNILLLLFLLFMSYELLWIWILKIVMRTKSPMKECNITQYFRLFVMNNK